MKFKFMYPAMMLITASILLSCSVNCFAQKESKKWSIGFFTESGLTLGDAKKLYKSDFGASLLLSVHAGPGLITLSGGGIAFIPDLSSQADTVFNNINGNNTSLNINVGNFKTGLHYPALVIDNLIPEGRGSLYSRLGTGIRQKEVVGYNFKNSNHA